MSMANIGTIPIGTSAENRPLGQSGDAGMVRLKPSSAEGVSTRARDFVYIAKECGYPYLILAIGSMFAWYGACWIGPNIVAKAIEPLATVAKTNEMLAEREEKFELNLQRSNSLMESVNKAMEKQTNILDALSRGQSQNTTDLLEIKNRMKGSL